MKVENLNYLQIGVQGENAATAIQIDMSSWIAEFPNASFHILFKPYNETIAVPVLTEYVAPILTWTPTAGETAVVGVGYAEVRAIDASTGLIKKTRIIPTSVENSVSGNESADPPAPYESWVNSVLAYKTAAEAAKTAAQAAQTGAEGAEDNAEAWAVGTKNGAAVPDTSPQYHNHSKYHSDQSAASAAVANNAKNVAIAARDATLDAQSGAEAIASAAYRKIDNMTVAAETLAAGSGAAATVSDVNGHKHILFGIPTGPQGERGMNGIVLSVDPGFYSFHVDDNGDLILTYSGSTAPNFEIIDGDLYYTYS